MKTKASAKTDDFLNLAGTNWSQHHYNTLVITKWKPIERGKDPGEQTT